MGFPYGLFVLLPLASGAHGGEGEAVPPLLDPEGVGLIFWTGLTFLAVFLILRKYAWGPLLEALEGRERTIREALDEARQDRAEAKLLLEQYEQKLEASRREAEAIIKEGAEDKARIIREAHEKALGEAEEVKVRATRDIELAKTKALAELREATVDLAMGLASKVLREEIDRERHHGLVESFLTEQAR